MPASARCEECGSSLAPDQRYCVACGARRGTLPPAAAAMIAGTRVAAASPAPIAARAPRAWFPAPHVAAVAVLAVLGFGVLVGSSVRPVQTGTRAAVALLPPAAPLAAPAAAAVAPVEVPATEPVDTSVAGDSASADSSTAGSDGASKKSDGSPPASSDSTLPDINHVFLIVLSGHGFDQAFGDGSAAPYLAKTLTGRGELLANYHAVAQGELANEIALISGQGPTVQTAGNCPTYADITPATIADDGQVKGDGCVYPARATTVGDQLTAKGKSWKAYVEDLHTGLPAGASDCRHPVPGAADGENAPRPQDPYTTWRNPFVYFHSIVDGEPCDDGEADLAELEPDLASAASTPSLAYVVPNRCHDGSDSPCAPGQPAGLAAADEFLRKVVPAIEASAAYKDGGLIAITFDQAPQTGPDADSSSCCNSPLFPNLPDTKAPAATRAAPRAQAVVEAPPATIPEAPAQPQPAPESAVAATAPAAAAAVAAEAPPEVATPVSPPADTPPADTPPAAAPAPAAPAAPPAPPAPSARGADGEPIGGGKVGLLLISSFVKAGSVNRVERFNHFSLLRSIEDLFGLKPLGYAADPSLLAFDKAIYNAKSR